MHTFLMKLTNKQIQLDFKYHHRISLMHIPMIGYVFVLKDLLNVQLVMRDMGHTFNILMEHLTTFGCMRKMCSNYESEIMAVE